MASTMAHQRVLSSVSNDDLFSGITGLDDDLSFDDDNLGGLGGGAEGGNTSDNEDLDNDEEGGEGEDSLGDLQSSTTSGGVKKGKRNKLRNSSTAEKKATHNAVERARRESLNTRFLVLADMLPGMTHVKRASKAAIVNKSIEFIREMQASETRLAKQNEALRADLEVLKARISGGNAAAPASLPQAQAQVQAQQSAAAAAAAAVIPVQQQQQQQQALFPGMHPMQMPMMPHLPAAMAAAAAANPLFAAAAAQQAAVAVHAQQQQQQAQQQQQQAQQQHHVQQQMMYAHQQQQQQQQQQQSQGMPPLSGGADIGQHLFPSIFTGLFNAGGAFDGLENMRSESGSPGAGGGSGSGSHHSHSSPPSSATQGQFAHGLFEISPSSSSAMPSSTFNPADYINTNGASTGNGGQMQQSQSQTQTLNQNQRNGSPASYASPPGTVASLAGSERTSQSSQFTQNTAPSPASSNGLPTPSNAYSPLNLPMLVGTPQQSHTSKPDALLSTGNGNGNTGHNNTTTSGGVDPAIAAFDGSHDAAYLAANFAPNDLAKAQQDLQTFIAYQQRMSVSAAANAAANANAAPTTTNGLTSPPLLQSSMHSFPYQQQHQQHHHSQQQSHQAQAQQHYQQQAAGAAAAAAANNAMCGQQHGQQAGMGGMPAWQMMMAQHQAMVAAYSGAQAAHY